MRTRHLNGLLIAAILLISTTPLYAQRQQQDVPKLKADARNVVGAIGADKDKTKTYCRILDLSGQADEAKQEKNSKKATHLSRKIDLLQKKLGPDFVALAHALEDIDPETPDGRELNSIIESLDQSCEE
jgi:hypothetical protein